MQQLPYQQQHESMNISSISTHQPQPQAGGNTATIAHSPTNAQALYELYRQTTTPVAGSATPLPAAAGAAGASASAVATTQTAAVNVSAQEAKEQRQRQQIINHVNALIDYCEIPQKNKNERITSLRQCSSSFFVLLCQRLFRENIIDIDIYPNTPQKKRHNVELVLEELRKHHYNVDGISAEEVVQLNETDLSRLILLFVGIAQEDGMTIGGGDADKLTASGGGVVGAGISPQPPSMPYEGGAGAGSYPTPQGYTIAEVSAAGASPPTQHQQQQQALPAGEGYYYYPQGHDQHEEAGFPAHGMSPQQRQQLMMMMMMAGGGYFDGGAEGNAMTNAANMVDSSGNYAPQQQQQPPRSGSGYDEEGQVQPEEGTSLLGEEDDDDDMVPRDEYVSSWNQGVVVPKVRVTVASHRQPLQPPLPLQEQVKDVQRRIKEAERLADESLLRRRHQQQQHQQHQQQQQQQQQQRKPGAAHAHATPPGASASARHSTRSGTDGPIPTPSSSLTPTNAPSSNAHQHHHHHRTAGNHGRGGGERGAANAGYHASATGTATYRADPQQHARPPLLPPPVVVPFEEPPLTRVECRLLASHPNRLIDAGARDEKIERLRAARFLGDAQTRLRQRMRREYDSELSSMREELKATLRLAQRDKLDLLRRVRDENNKYKEAYAALMEAAANDPHISRHLMSSSTAQHAAFYADSLRESRRMCEYLQQESDHRTLAEVTRFAKTTSDWQQRMPV